MGIPPWRVPRLIPRLGQSEVHIWRFDLSRADPRYFALLSREERTRAGAFYRSQDRDRYLSGRASLRLILSRYVDRPPQDLLIETGEAGKPALAGIVGLEFNLTHSDDLSLLAVTRSGPIGIDVERVRADIDHAAIAGSDFSVQERAALKDLSPCDLMRRFSICWVRKEAYLKARGEGLARPLGSFVVSITDEARLVSDFEDPSATEHWRVDDVPCAPDYVAAVAYNARACVSALLDGSAVTEQFSLV